MQLLRQEERDEGHEGQRGETAHRRPGQGPQQAAEERKQEHVASGSAFHRCSRRPLRCAGDESNSIMLRRHEHMIRGHRTGKDRKCRIHIPQYGQDNSQPPQLPTPPTIRVSIFPKREPGMDINVRGRIGPTGSLSVLSTLASGRHVCGKTTHRRCSTLISPRPLLLSGKTRYRLTS